MAAFDFPSSPNVNDIYTLNGVAFMWNGSVWKRYSTSTGAQGFQGAAGAAGAAGAQGAQGTAGVLGGDGAQGAVGAQGATGTGATGAQGAAGAAGAQGATGAAGAQGAPFDRSEYNYTASGGQTAFAAAYANASDVDVFMNGVRLTPAEYTASGGTTITLASGATAGDIIDILTFASAGPTGAQGSQGHQGDAFNRSESNFTATSGQTSFAPSGGYTNGDDLDVFVNGVRLTPADYTASNGTNVVLDVGANTGDIVDIIYYEAAGPAGAQGAAGAAGIAGTITFATSAPSNPIMGDLWYDTDDGAFAGYYNDGNTSQWIDLSGGPRGAQGADGAQGAAGSIPSNITAVNGTFSGNVSIAGTLTYEDVTNIDSVGVITARDTLTVYNAAATFDPHLTLYAENSNNAILVSKKASGYTGLEFRAESGGGGSIDLFYGAPSVQGANSSYYSGIQLNDNKALIMGTGADGIISYDPTPGVLEIKTIVSEPIALYTNDTERIRISSDGRFKIGSISDYSNNVTNCPVYIAMQTDITAIGDDEGGATAGLVRIEETGSNNNRYHGIDLRNTNSGDIRILNQDVGVSDRGDLVIAMPDGDANDGIHNKMRFNSRQSSIQISGKGGAVAANNDVTHTDIYIATKTGLTAVGTGAGGEVAGLIRFEDIGSNNSRYHGIELRNKNSGDARILNLDEATSNKASMVFATDDGSTVQERLRITSGGHVNIGGEYSQTDSKVTIVDVSRPIAEATLNLQSSTTSGAADTGPVLRFYGHSGSEPRYHASIKGAKENGTSGNTAGYLAFNTRPAGGGAMAERLRISSNGALKHGPVSIKTWTDGGAANGVTETKNLIAFNTTNNNRVYGEITIWACRSGLAQQRGYKKYAIAMSVYGGNYYGFITETQSTGVTGFSTLVIERDGDNIRLRHVGNTAASGASMTIMFTGSLTGSASFYE